MSDKQVNFAFAIGDKVSITLNGREGTVEGQYNDKRGTSYYVDYADANGLVSSRYFRDDEIAAI